MEEDVLAVLRRSDMWHELYVKCIRLLISGLFLALSVGTGYLVHALLTHSFLAKLNSQAGHVIEIVLDVSWNLQNNTTLITQSWIDY